MEWTDIRLTVAKADADNAEAVATMIAEGGIYIEDYSDIEQQVAEIAHVDLIEQELLDKPRDTVIIHMYLEPGAPPPKWEALAVHAKFAVLPRALPLGELDAKRPERAHVLYNSIVPDSAVGCKPLGKMYVKRKEFSTQRRPLCGKPKNYRLKNCQMRTFDAF